MFKYTHKTVHSLRIVSDMKCQDSLTKEITNEPINREQYPFHSGKCKKMCMLAMSRSKRQPMHQE